MDGLREASVLVPILAPAPERLLFTVRRAELPTHAGQISFPGGKREVSDVDAAAAALRETNEELSIVPSDVEVLGILDDVPTPTGFLITPIVGYVRDTATPTASPLEVAEIFSPPLFELAHHHHDGGERTFMGHVYQMHEYHWPGQRIWGATARIVHQLLTLLAD